MSLRERLIEHINKDLYHDEINKIKAFIRVTVKLINIYIEHQDKIYEKIFKEDVYCELMYDENVSLFFPIVVLRSKTNQSSILRVKNIPSICSQLSDHVDIPYIAFRYALCANIYLDENEIKIAEDKIYDKVLADSELDESGDPINKEQFDYRLSSAIRDFLRNPKKSRSVRSVERLFDISFDYEEMSFFDKPNDQVIFETIKNKNLYNNIFIFHSRNPDDDEPLPIVYLLNSIAKDNQECILKKVAYIKSLKFMAKYSIDYISDELNTLIYDEEYSAIEDIINTEYILIKIYSENHLNRLIRNFNYVNFSKESSFKGVIKSINICVDL